MRLFYYAKDITIINSIIYKYRINPFGAMRNSNLNARLNCSIMLNIDLNNFVKTNKLKRVKELIAISTAWCIRIAPDNYARILYSYAKDNGMFPLKISGNWKQKLQIVILNFNFNFYRLICRLL